MSLAAAAAGADGFIVEVHNQPDQTKSDGFQALDLNQFAGLMKSLEKLLPALGRRFQPQIG